MVTGVLQLLVYVEAPLLFICCSRCEDFALLFALPSPPLPSGIRNGVTFGRFVQALGVAAPGPDRFGVGTCSPLEDFGYECNSVVKPS